MSRPERRASRKVEALKSRRDWQARYSQMRTAKLTATVAALSIVIAPGVARHFFGFESGIPLVLLISLAVSALGSTGVWLYARRKLDAIEEGYISSTGENIRGAIVEEQLDRFLGEELRASTVDRSSDRV